MVLVLNNSLGLGLMKDCQINKLMQNKFTVSSKFLNTDYYFTLLYINGV